MPSLIPGPSPEGRRVKSVLGMAPSDDCMREMFAIAGRRLGVPLAQLDPVKPDNMTHQSMEDWRYWEAMGHVFSSKSGCDPDRSRRP